MEAPVVRDRPDSHTQTSPSRLVIALLPVTHTPARDDEDTSEGPTFRAVVTLLVTETTR